MRQLDEKAPVADRLAAARRARIVGRAAELSWLERALIADQLPVVFVHGIGGIGKTTLLDALAQRLVADGCRVLRFSGHELEPTPEGVLDALAEALELDDPVIATVLAGLERAARERVVIAFDEYDGLRLIDAWLRDTLAPQLPGRVHVLAIGRSRPVAAWSTTPGWDALSRALELGPLADDDALKLASDAQVPAELQRPVCALAAGHPLALKLAAAALAARPELPLAEIESRHVIAELVQRFLADLRDPGERAAVEAASVVRRVTRPLLARLLGEADARESFDALRALPFVETGASGLVLHQSVRHAVASSLRALDPARHRELRTRAWLTFSEDLGEASSNQRWQTTADVTYLLDHPEIREAFFPSDVIRYGVERARAADRDAIVAAARQHAGQSEARIIERWWSLAPHAFSVVRDDAQTPLGFYAALFESDVSAALLESDPVLQAWLAHRAQRFARDGRPLLLVRAILSARNGAAPSEERACCYLDIKRLYMQHLDLAAVYAADHGDQKLPIYDRLGFAGSPALSVVHADGRRVHGAVLDFGPGVLSWLARLIDAQCTPLERGAPQPPFPCSLDLETRELRVEGERKPLTRLELGVLQHLAQRVGRVASRDELLESVWGQAHTGSNVVDVVVRSLRKKLGAHAGVIQTVTGFGYKLRQEWGSRGQP